MPSAIKEEEFLSRMDRLHPDIEVIGKFINMDTKVQCKCKKDGYIWMAPPKKLIYHKHGCPKCGGSLKLTNEEFVEQAKEKNKKIKVIGTYINIDTPILVECVYCGKQWNMSPYHIREGKSCPSCMKKECAKKLSKTTQEFISEMKKIDPTIQIIGDYKNSKTKIKCRCVICKKTWEAIPTNLLKQRGCPSCSMSKGEKRIKTWLENHGIQFQSEYRFNDCKYIRPLPFDFYLKKYNTVIEYDGQQHYFPVPFDGDFKKAQEIFDQNKERDKIKNDYCKNNGINMIRISYTKYDDINKILEKYFL